ncbi:MAG: hypothetical protein K2M34_04095 [Alphaproteobacteria bacterium]|nr:hypothetical protein [Alphaproteobacteria bacterium]
MEKLLKVLKDNMMYTIVLIAAIVLFLYTTNFDIIGGALTALSGVIATVCVVVLVRAYKAMPAPKKTTSKKKSK